MMSLPVLINWFVNTQRVAPLVTSRTCNLGFGSRGFAVASIPKAKRKFIFRPFLGTSAIFGTYLCYLLVTDAEEPPKYYRTDLNAKLFRVFPFNGISRAWGWLAECTLPTFTRPYIFGLYAQLCNCNLDEIANPDLKSYTSLAEFFSRRLAPGQRPIDSKALLVCPSDGLVLHFGRVDPKSPYLEQVKGCKYSLSEFLGPIGLRSSFRQNLPTKTSSISSNDRALYQCVIYLAPGDYHHFHSPADWKPTIRRHFAGKLLSVKPEVTKRLPGLFSLNERAAFLGEWKYGLMTLTAVGALGVGSIQIPFDPQLTTNRSDHKRHFSNSSEFVQPYSQLILPQNMDLTKGQDFGSFRMGSTIVLVFEAPSDGISWAVREGQHVKYGQALLVDQSYVKH